MSTFGPRAATAKSSSGKNAPKPQQARNNVRDLLINKLMAKFGKMANASSVVSAKVTKFMQQSRVTEANLKKLEKEILVALTAPKQPPAAPPKQSSPQPRPQSSSKKPEEPPQVKSVEKTTVI